MKKEADYMLRGIRGATTADTNSRSDIMAAAKELLALLINENNLNTEDIGAIIFSSTPDINAAFPAAGARELGLTEVPLFGTQEIDCPTGVKNCIRILILTNTELTQKDVKHLYLKGAAVLRPEYKRS